MLDLHGKSANTGTGQPVRGEVRTPEAIRLRIERAVERAKLALLWERLWPRLAPLACLILAFALLSWFGFWRVAPDILRFALLAAFALAGIALVIFAVRIRLPEAPEALARVERASGVAHRPATAINDRLASAPDDAQARILWEAHRRRLLANFGRLKAGVPSPGLARRDPFAFRFLLILVAVVGFLFAGPDRFARMAEAFRIGEPIAEVAARVDAWATPPAYTSRPPVFLTGANARQGEGPLSLPTGSVVTVRIASAPGVTVAYVTDEGEVEILAAETSSAAPRIPERSGSTGVAPREHRVELRAASQVVVRRGGDDVVAWAFAVEPDALPEIAVAGEPQGTVSGALKLTYTVKDDYGVIDARAEFGLPEDAVTGERRPLIEPPVVALSLPQLRIREGIGETINDLSAHPWAGGKVRMTLIAGDEAGQEGKSEPIEFVLPARVFGDPLARAVVEQRRELALDANRVRHVAAALDALTIAPDKYFEDLGKFLALRIAYNRTVNAKTDDQLREVVELLWDIALGIEDGELSLAARDLRAAQQALREALERGASEEEIKRLTEQLRAAMQQFLQALAQQMQRNPNMANMPPGDMQTLRPEDLERMLDRIQELAETGANDAARQLLDQLQSMLENLQAGMPQQGGEQGEMQEMMQELGEMIRRQQELMDQTHRAERGQRPDGNPNGEPMTPEEMAEALKNLQQQQGSLQQQLQELMEKLQGMGMQQPGEFGQAERSMGDAEGSLGEGQPGSALGSQGDALEALRRGAQGMMQQFGMQPGQGQGYGGRGGGDVTETDPLGRPTRNEGTDLGSQVKVPDEIDTQRAREILDAIRQRLADPGRPVGERNYLERLLGQ